MERKKIITGITVGMVSVYLITCIIPVLGSSQQITIFNNFDPNNSYHPNYNSAIGYYRDFDYNDLYDIDTAMAFTPSNYSYTLSKVELGVSLEEGINELDVWIMQDNDNMPGQIIETIRVSGVMNSYPGVYPPVTAVSVLTPILNANTQYWIGLSAPGPNDIQIKWHINTIGYEGRGVQRQRINGIGSWTYYGPEECTFRVTGIKYTQTIYVDDDSPGDPLPGNPNISDPNEDGSEQHPYDSIQEAITGASNGDTVLIADGNYTGFGNSGISFLGKAIAVQSQNGPDNCVIDCEFMGRAFYFVNFEDSNSVLDGVTITNGWDDDNGGGGIYCDSSSPIISNCIINDCQAPDGGGIKCNYNSNPLISRCIIIQNEAVSGNGAGLYCDSSSNPTVTNSYIGYNTAAYSGGGMAGEYNSPTVQNSVFVGNEALNGDGGGIYCGGYFSYPSITNCTVTYNSASNFGGGIYCGYDVYADIINCIAYFNTALYNAQINLGQYTPSFCCIQDWIVVGTDNINTNPSLKTDRFRLKWDSPCRDAGNPTSGYAGQTDIDEEARVMNYRVDIGADELQPPVINEDTGATYNTIQDAINDAVNGETIIVNPGVHFPPNSFGIDFWGKEITVCGSDPNDPNVVMATVVNCLGDARGFNFHNNEGPNSVLMGLTIANGISWDQFTGGGGIYCYQSNPTISNCMIRDCQAERGGGIYYDFCPDSILYNCIIKDNTATIGDGGGIYCRDTDLTIDNCRIKNNSPDGVWLDALNTLLIKGTVQIISNNLVGLGDMQVDSGANLSLFNAKVFLNMSGAGTMEIEAGSETIIDGNAIINLADPYDPNIKGIINGLGFLRVANNARITNARINLTRAVFTNKANISNCEIHINKNAPYGAVFIDPNTSFYNNDIYADGDRYMDLNPAIFDGNFVNCRIFVTITEGVNDTRGGLFECRGEPDLTDINFCDVNNVFLCKAESGTIPDCNLRSWTLERLELTPSSKLNLTNRFPFQPPYDSGTDYDVVYVKELILREGAVLNTSYNKIYYDTLITEPNALVKNEPLLGFSMINIAFDDETEYLARVTHSNFTHPNDPNLDRINIDRVEGLIPDPNGMMIMQNLSWVDPNQNLQTTNARAKGLFSKSSEDEVLIRFEYLFETFDPNTELVVFLSDIPELGDSSDVNHYYEVARITPPIIGQPGSMGSGRFGVFEDYVPTGGLDFIMGTRIELLLLGPAGTVVYINNWDPQVLCDGICLDLNWSDSADEEDFLLVVGNCGTSTELDSGGDTYACLEGPFGTDGTVDSHDICGWDWALNDGARLNLCGPLPLTGGTATSTSSIMRVSSETSGIDTETNTVLVALPTGGFDDLLLSGKKGTTGAITKMQDGIYVFDENGEFSESLMPASDRGNLRLVDDFEGNIYAINTEIGVLRVDNNEVIVASAAISGVHEPRYDSMGSVYIGLQGTGDDTFGRPVLDAAFDVDFDTNNYIYVVPVIVEPASDDPYMAAAKLQLTGGGSYSIVQIYDDPDANNIGDNRELNALREIETDGLGSLYVINAHALNESDTIWRYNCSTGAMVDRLTLGNPASSDHVPSPGGLHASRFEQMLYLGSSLSSPDANSISVYGFSTSGVLALARTVKIMGMGHISDITEDPISGTLWVVGFSMDPPQYPNPYALPFYDPNLAQIPIGAIEVVAVNTLTADPENDLALPLSIVWTGPLPQKCGGADLDGNGIIDLPDFARIALYWLDMDCASKSHCQGADLEPEYEPDGDVDIGDLSILSENWLNDACSN